MTEPIRNTQEALPLLMRPLIFFGFLLLVSLPLHAQQEPTFEASPASEEGQFRKPFTPARLLAIVESSNDTQRRLIRSALLQSGELDIRNLIQKMSEDYTTLNRRIEDLAQRLDITPNGGDLSEDIWDDGRFESEELEFHMSRSFDREFMDRLIRLHEDFINLLDTELLTQAMDPEVAALLREARETYASNLEEARNVRIGL